jgi:hypothetical protein
VLLRDPVCKWLSNAFYWTRPDAMRRSTRTDGRTKAAAFLRETPPEVWTAADVANVESHVKTYSNEFTDVIGTDFLPNLAKDFVIGNISTKRNFSPLSCSFIRGRG